MEFIPSPDEEQVKVPYFEDASNEEGVVGYSTQRSEPELKGLIRTAMGKLGGVVHSFQSGMIGTRHAYRIRFHYQGAPGRMDVVALPIKSETEGRIKQAKKHALYSVWKRLEGLFNAQLVTPDDLPLMPYMLNKQGQTVTEWLRDSGQFQLPEPSYQPQDEDVIEGDFTEE